MNKANPFGKSNEIDENIVMATMSVRAMLSLLLALVVGMILVSIWMFNTTRKSSNTPRTGSSESQNHLSCGPLPAPEPLPEKVIIVRSVYWDNRSRKNTNSTSVHVFMVEIAQSALEMRSVVGCQVGNSLTTDFKVVPLASMPWVHRHYSNKYDMAMINCFKLSGENGSRAYIFYKNATAVISVESERPLFIPAPHVSPSVGKKSTVMACAVVYGTPPLFEHWLRYQRTIGIDHIYLIAEDSFRDAGNLEKSPLKEMMRSGYLSIDFWTPHLTSQQIFYHSQMLGYEDCIYRYQGTYDYVMANDVDIFYVLLLPGEPYIQYYAEKWCSVGTCTFDLIQYFRDCGIDEVGPDGNVTAHLLSNKSFKRPEGKSGHNLLAVSDIGIHRAMVLLPGYDPGVVPRKAAYWAHVSGGAKDKLPGGKC